MGKRVAKLAAVPEPSSHNCCSKRRRVGSARARKTRCECSSVITCFFSPLGEMLFRITSNKQYKRTRTAQALHDFLALEVSTQPVQALLPAILVVAIGFLCWNRLRQGSKPRLNQRQEGPFGAFFPGKLDGTAYAKIHITHHPKPTGKLFWFGDGIPDTLTRDGQKHGSFDTIRKGHGISSQGDAKCVCLFL